MSKYHNKETVNEKINRLQGYYSDSTNGLNKSWLFQKINELKNNQ